MGVRKVMDFYSQPSRQFIQLLDGPGTITANTYLRGNSAGTELEFSNILPAFVGWYFIDTNAGLLSLSSGNLLMGATGTYSMVAAIVDVSTGQFYANAGMLVGAPSSGGRTIGFAVETAAQPGVYFRSTSGGAGYISFENGTTPAAYHQFGISDSTLLGDVIHTDGTRYCRYDASTGIFTLESTNGNPEVSLDGSTGDVSLTGELKGARTTMDAGARSQVAATTSGYLSTHTVAHSSTVGLVMPRAGSIVGLSGLVSASGHAGTGDMTFEVRKNNTVVLSAAVSVTGNGVFKVVSTQARGTDTFSASDLVQLSWTNAGTYAKDSILLTVELQFDT